MHTLLFVWRVISVFAMEIMPDSADKKGSLD